MNGLNEQPYSELMYRFMDGETNEVQQKVLFDALAKDSELQFEFQQAVTITKGFNADKITLLPPARLTNSLFASAGFNAPMQFAQTGASSFLRKFQRIAIPVSSALVGALISAFVFFGFYSQDNSDSISSLTEPINNSTIKNNDFNNSVFSEILSIEKKSTANATKNMISNNNIAGNEIESDIIGQNINKTILDKTSAQISAMNESKDFSTLTDEPFSTSIKDAGIMNLALEVKGNANLAFLPGRDIAPEKFNIANNIAMGLLYEFTDNHSAGLYLGRESLQMYTYSQIGDEYIFNLEPSLFWAGACYKYTGGEIYGSIHPFGELILAGSKFGPVGKTSLGLTYNPENFISMSLGLEGSSLMYKFLGEYKTTEKVSLIYNIGIHF